ncbi:MAG: DUF3467 domain-containing protein [Desulfobacteraceae bacterium]|nr:DUF3467 domain-containing protein [Desulfobacteraceae bacterium]MBC2755136.1 DUF3467 domain-containing protein [Desulfobacteraceae bacterium]
MTQPDNPPNGKDQSKISPTETTGTDAPTVKWDDSDLNTSYANVCNAAITREEFTLFFGTNQTWNLREGDDIKVQLSNRVVVSPFAAKRLSILLDRVLKEYESRFGKLDIGPPRKE